MMKAIRAILEMGRVFCSSVHKLVLSVLRIVKVYLLVTGQGGQSVKRRKSTGFFPWQAETEFW